LDPGATGFGPVAPKVCESNRMGEVAPELPDEIVYDVIESN
jgi:hypothetical protein